MGPQTRSKATRHRSQLVHELPHPPPGTILREIHDYLGSIGAPHYRYRQLVLSLQQRGTAFANSQELPDALRQALTARFGPSVAPLTPVEVQEAEQVEKVLFETRSGARVETVLSRYRAGWSSLCISSQAGCGLACSFCATGAIGLVQNLTADEICAQVVHSRWLKVIPSFADSIAFMGMGEALANPHTFTAIDLLTTPGYGGFSPRRITVSTVGFAPNLRRLAKEHPQVTITLSVHSPFAEQRAELIPLERRFPLGENLEILDEHVAATRRKVYLAYLLIANVNDSADHLEALTQLVKSRMRPELFHVSVIRYNAATGADASYRAPTSHQVSEFVAQLNARGVHATRRQQFGSSISAACGQLHARSLLRERASRRA